MSLHLTQEEASNLSILLTYKELDKLKEQKMNGGDVSNEEKYKALEACFDLNLRLIRGEVSSENVLNLVVEWKEYFKKHPARFHQKIHSILQIEEKAKSLLK